MKIAIVGYGNLGRHAAESIEAAGDMELCGIVMRPQSVGKIRATVQVADEIGRLDTRPDTALLCAPTRAVPDIAEKCLEQGVCTVDSYDIHAGIPALLSRLDAAAKRGGAAAVVSAGFDPGVDSIVRALMEAAAPRGKTFTNFGPGMSMGHTAAAKAVEGVKNALSMTIPLGAGIHRRMVYLELLDGFEFDDVAAKIKADPYFSGDETHVCLERDVNALTDTGHGVSMIRKGGSGQTHNQLLEFNMRINNPALTAQVMVACARAGAKRPPGAYTMIDIPVADLLEGGRDELIKRLV